MAKKPRKPTKKQLAAKRAAFDRVFAAANAERTDMISLYDIAIWLLYACMRSDAISTAKEMVESQDQTEDGDLEGELHTIAYEIDEQIDCAFDDHDSAVSHERSIEEIGRQLDPEFDKPAYLLVDWLDQA